MAWGVAAIAMVWSAGARVDVARKRGEAYNASMAWGRRECQAGTKPPTTTKHTGRHRRPLDRLPGICKTPGPGLVAARAQGRGAAEGEAARVLLQAEALREFQKDGAQLEVRRPPEPPRSAPPPRMASGDLFSLSLLESDAKDPPDAPRPRETFRCRPSVDQRFRWCRVDGVEVERHAIERHRRASVDVGRRDTRHRADTTRNAPATHGRHAGPKSRPRRKQGPRARPTRSLENRRRARARPRRNASRRRSPRDEHGKETFRPRLNHQTSRSWEDVKPRLLAPSRRARATRRAPRSATTTSRRAPSGRTSSRSAPRTSTPWPTRRGRRSARSPRRRRRRNACSSTAGTKWPIACAHYCGASTSGVVAP